MADEAKKFADSSFGLIVIFASLSPDGRSLAPGRLTVDSGAESLAVTVIRCGLKTLLLTKLGWESDISNASNPK